MGTLCFDDLALAVSGHRSGLSGGAAPGCGPKHGKPFIVNTPWQPAVKSSPHKDPGKKQNNLVRKGV
jgi:hypothetical protein